MASIMKFYLLGKLLPVAFLACANTLAKKLHSQQRQLPPSLQQAFEEIDEAGQLSLQSMASGLAESVLQRDRAAQPGNVDTMLQNLEARQQALVQESSHVDISGAPATRLERAFETMDPRLDDPSIRRIEMSLINLARQTPTNATLNMVREIKSIVQDVLIPHVINQSDEVERQVEEERLKGYTECFNTSDNGTNSSSKATLHFSNLSQQHKNCRLVQASLYWQVQNLTTDWLQAEEWRRAACETYNSSNQIPDADECVQNSKGMRDFIVYLRDKFQLKMQDEDALNATCTNMTQLASENKNQLDAANQSLINQQQLCDYYQMQMDTAACNYLHGVDELCGLRNQCYNSTMTAYYAALANAQRLQIVFRAEYRAMKRIECLVLEWLNFSLATGIEECIAKRHSTEPVEMSFNPHEAENHTTCYQLIVNESALYWPLSQAYNLSEYAPLPAVAPAEPCSAYCCLCPINVTQGECLGCSNATSCSAVDCNANYFDTDGDTANGCEKGCPNVIGGNCTACSSSSMCTNVTCNITAFDIDENAANGCEKGCPDVSNGHCTACSGPSTCTNVACKPNYYNLDGNADNGCEVGCPNVSNGNCTACSSPSSCTDVICDANTYNMDGNANNGCEGTCPTVPYGNCTACASASNCTNVTCVFNRWDYDGDASNGCEIGCKASTPTYTYLRTSSKYCSDWSTRELDSSLQHSSWESCQSACSSDPQCTACNYGCGPNYWLLIRGTPCPEASSGCGSYIEYKQTTSTTTQAPTYTYLRTSSKYCSDWSTRELDSSLQHSSWESCQSACSSDPQCTACNYGCGPNYWLLIRETQCPEANSGCGSYIEYKQTTSTTTQAPLCTYSRTSSKYCSDWSTRELDSSLQHSSWESCHSACSLDPQCTACNYGCGPNYWLLIRETPCPEANSGCGSYIEYKATTCTITTTTTTEVSNNQSEECEPDIPTTTAATTTTTGAPRRRRSSSDSFDF